MFHAQHTTILVQQISTTDRTHARTGPDKQRAQAHNHTRNPDAPHVHTHTHTRTSRHITSGSATPTRERSRQGNHRLRDLHRDTRAHTVPAEFLLDTCRSASPQQTCRRRRRRLRQSATSQAIRNCSQAVSIGLVAVEVPSAERVCTKLSSAGSSWRADFASTCTYMYRFRQLGFGTWGGLRLAMSWRAGGTSVGIQTDVSWAFHGPV